MATTPTKDEPMTTTIDPTPARPGQHLPRQPRHRSPDAPLYVDTTGSESEPSLKASSQSMKADRRRGMTLHLEAPSARLTSLSTRQLAALQRVWQTAGLPPTYGYEAAFLAVAVTSDPALVETLSSIDLDDAQSVANAVVTLLQWRRRVTG